MNRIQARSTALLFGGLSLVLGLGVMPALCVAAPSDLDATFGTGGLVTTDFSGVFDFALDVAIQADGKIVVAGAASQDFALARYNTGGSLDITFGTGGLVTTDFASNSDEVFAVAVQVDGKIVAAGSAMIGGVNRACRSWHGVCGACCKSSAQCRTDRLYSVRAIRKMSAHCGCPHHE